MVKASNSKRSSVTGRERREGARRPARFCVAVAASPTRGPTSIYMQNKSHAARRWFLGCQLRSAGLCAAPQPTEAAPMPTQTASFSHRLALVAAAGSSQLSAAAAARSSPHPISMQRRPIRIWPPVCSLALVLQL
jgi:hypothetical protein